MVDEVDGTGGAESPVVLRAEGTETPLFLVHDESGQVPSLGGFGHHLGQDFPLYGLQLADARHGRSVESLAAFHVKSLRAIQPNGPYRIAGYGLGGLVAYEIANQLLGANEAVSFIGLIDPCAVSPGGRVNAGRAAARREQVNHSVERVVEALDTAAGSYCIEPLHVPVTLFTTARQEDDIGDSSHGWNTMLKDDVVVCSVPRDRLEEAVSTTVRQSTVKRAKGPSNESPTVMIQTYGTSKPAVFCAPGAGAGVTCFLPFAEAFNRPVNIVGLQPRGLDGLHVPHSTVEAAAESSVEAIRRIAPTGPYRLLGHSFGGWVVFEIAQRLVAVGEQVAPVVLLDAEPPSLEDAVPGRHRRVNVLMKFVRVLERVTGQGLGFRAEEFEGLDLEGQLERLLRRMQAAKILPRSSTTTQLRHQIRVFAANVNSVYRPKVPLRGEAYLLQTTDLDLEDEDAVPLEEAVLRWKIFAPSLKVISAGGNHLTMLERPHVDAIADLAATIWEGSRGQVTAGQRCADVLGA